MTLPEPTLSDQRTDVERLRDALPDLELRVDLPAVRGLARALRAVDDAGDRAVTAVVVDDVLVDVEPGDTSERLFGIAFDLGTTTVVATLLDLATGTPVAVASLLNPQQPYGADVITRISATMMDPDALGRLTALAHEGLDQLVGEVCADGGVDRREVYEIALAGNATMAHLALGLDPEPLGVAPFVMASRSFDDLVAADLGVFVHPRARAYVFPALGAYVGGDIVAGALASGMDRDRRIRLFIDIGTNCEILLAAGDRLLATAAPAGPAFEGAAIRCGMRAAPGAVEGVKISDEDVLLQVIGDVAPVGLAGSGLVDAVAAMVAAGLVDASGRLVAPDAPGVPPGLAARLRQVGQERVFVLRLPGRRARAATPTTRPRWLYLSQRDIRELQFAKAAIATGWMLLLEEQGLTAADVAQVLLAGSFGSYLSPTSAVRIGLVPDVALLRIVSAGNVAGEGAKMALLSLRERAAAQALLEEVHYVELSDRADFNDRFVDRLAFPSESSGGSPSWRAGRSPGTSPTSPPAAAGPSTCIRCRRCCTTGRSGSPPRSSGACASCVPGTGGWRSPTPTAGPTARWTTCAPGSAVPRLPGTDCYEVFAGAARMRALLEAEPGTYVLTDYLATSFHRSVVVELGLDRFPELRDDYFGHYRRVVWLAQHPTARVRAAAERAAGMLGLPLEEVVVGDALLEKAVEQLVGAQP